MARNSAFRGFQYPKSRHGSTTSTNSSKFKFTESQPRNRSGSKVSVFSIMFPSWPDDAVVFLTLCLDPEPSARPTCGSLLRLPYFTHDNFPTRFLSELNQKLQQEGRSPIKAFSKKQQQRIANVSPSVPIPPKHIQSSHPILRNISLDEAPSLKLFQSQTASTASTSSLNRQQTFIVEKLNNGKPSKTLQLESRIPRKLSDDSLVVATTAATTVAPVTTTISSIPLPPTASFSFSEAPVASLAFTHFQTHPQQQQPPQPAAQSQQTPLSQQHSSSFQPETRRFSMSKKYSEQADESSGRNGGGVDGLNMHINISNGSNSNGNSNRQLPVTTLTFLGSNMFMASNAPVPIRSPNNMNSISTNSLGQKKTSPKKSIFYSHNQSTPSNIKPIAFGSSVNKESFLPRMKVVDDTNTSFPFLALGSPSKPGTSSIRKRDKWEPSMSRKPTRLGFPTKV